MVDLPEVTADDNFAAAFEQLALNGDKAMEDLDGQDTQAGGAAANHRMLSLYNRGSAAGTGTTRVATLDLTSAAAGGTLTNNVASSLTLTSTTTFLTVAAGDVLEWESSMSATGMNDPGGRVIITYSRI